MGPQTSTNYSVDRRYKGMKYATDNEVGKQFLNRYIDMQRGPAKPTLAEDETQDGRLKFYGMGGTVPMNSLALGQQLRNTDAVAGAGNPFVKNS